MNILPHEKICDKVFDNLDEPFSLLTQDLLTLYGSTKLICSHELENIFTSSKIRPVILSFVHSCTRITSPYGNLSTILKATFATPLSDNYTLQDCEFLSLVNEFIHNREPNATTISNNDCKIIKSQSILF